MTTLVGRPQGWDPSPPVRQWLLYRTYVRYRIRMLVQRSFDDLGTPLAQVTFCVLDLETTGGSPESCSITEIGALKTKMGETLGTFQTLVDPGAPVPAFVRLLTGITDDLLHGAPRIEALLPSLLEFLAGTILVAHNARFDVGFLNAALRKHGYEPLDNPVIDTARLARKILHGEVPNHRLDTLARHLRCAHRPDHRAFPDVLATVDVLHHLIERVTGFGVTTLEDLTSITSARLDGTFHKLDMTKDLPRTRGIYRFLGEQGNTLYVGKATDIRNRVRSYFYGDPRRKIRDLLRQTHSVVAEVYGSLLEAEIAEARAIAAEQPPHNRAGKRKSNWYVKLNVRQKSPKLSAARVTKDDGAIYVGPFSSHRLVRNLIESFQDAAPVHRCSEPRKCSGCAFSEMGTCLGEDKRAHRIVLLNVATALLSDHTSLLAPLRDKMLRLAEAGRFEEAAAVRDRGAALERALASTVAARSAVLAGRIVVAEGSRALLFSGGKLIHATDIGPGGEAEATERLLGRAPRVAGERARVMDRATMTEIRILGRRVERDETVRLLHCDRGWSLPLGTRPQTLFGQRRAPTERRSARGNG